MLRVLICLVVGVVRGLFGVKTPFQGGEQLQLDRGLFQAQSGLEGLAVFGIKPRLAMSFLEQAANPVLGYAAIRHQKLRLQHQNNSSTAHSRDLTLRFVLFSAVKRNE